MANSQNNFGILFEEILEIILTFDKDYAYIPNPQLRKFN